MINRMFSTIRKFHELPHSVKQDVLMDRRGWPVKEVGYFPVKTRKLPTRDKGNLNEAFIIKVVLYLLGIISGLRLVLIHPFVLSLLRINPARLFIVRSEKSGLRRF